MQNLLPTIGENISQEFFKGKLENFLICLAISSHMKNNIINETAGKFFEEISLNAIYESLLTNCSVSDAKLILSELPKILSFNYPVVEKIRVLSIRLVQELQKFYRSNVEGFNPMIWAKIYELDNLQEILKTFNFYTKK